MSNSEPFIRDNASTLVARVYEALGEGDYQYEPPSQDNHHHAELLLLSKDRRFGIEVLKKEPGDRVIVRFISDGIKEHNALFGLDSNLVIYSTKDIASTRENLLKTLIAQELVRSGNPALAQLSADFVKELKGEAPVPPLSKQGQKVYDQLSRQALKL